MKTELKLGIGVVVGITLGNLVNLESQVLGIALAYVLGCLHLLVFNKIK